MRLRWIDSTGVSSRDLAELPALQKRTDGFLWLDIPEWSDDAEAVLTRDFHFHPMAIAESRNRNHIPRLHVYPHHVFIVVHTPEIGARGHMHYLELDQFVGEDFLVTVHGPLSPKVPLEAALRETEAVADGCMRPRRSASRTRSSPRSHAGNLNWSPRSLVRSA